MSAPQRSPEPSSGSPSSPPGDRTGSGQPPAAPGNSTAPGGPTAPDGPTTPDGPEERAPGAPPRRVLHLDVDAFLASVEQALEPALRGRPVVVGGLPTDRNLVMSCSYEARAFGVRPGMPLGEAARRCPAAVFRRGDSGAANRLRRETARVLLESSPRVEIASIDDFFVDVTGTERLHGPALSLAERIRSAVRERVHLPLTIGIGANRTLARLAGKLAKPGGIAEIRPGYEAAFLAGLPVGQLPGVGRSIGAALERFAIRTVGELRLVPRELLFASFGRDGLALWERARGVDPAPVEATCWVDEEGAFHERAPRSIRRDSTFEPEEARLELVEAMLCYLVERAADRLRRFGRAARTLEVRLRWVDTRPASSRHYDAEGLSRSARRTLRFPTDSTDDLWQAARELLRSFPRRRALVKRVGVTLENLVPANGWQGRLFGDAGDELRGAGGQSRADRHRRLDDALDRLREKLGFGGVVRGASAPIGETHPLGPDGYRLRTPSLNQ